ncbi:MAG: hypothetical protein WCW33_02875 [Candidatus Babeliales bacterium]|jgi:hypothetical protein
MLVISPVTKHFLFACAVTVWSIGISKAMAIQPLIAEERSKSVQRLEENDQKLERAFYQMLEDYLQQVALCAQKGNFFNLQMQHYLREGVLVDIIKIMNTECSRERCFSELREIRNCYDKIAAELGVICDAQCVEMCQSMAEYSAADQRRYDQQRASVLRKLHPEYTKMLKRVHALNAIKYDIIF